MCVSGGMQVMERTVPRVKSDLLTFCVFKKTCLTLPWGQCALQRASPSTPTPTKEFIKDKLHTTARCVNATPASSY